MNKPTERWFFVYHPTDHEVRTEGYQLEIQLLDRSGRALHSWQVTTESESTASTPGAGPSQQLCSKKQERCLPVPAST